MLSVKVFFQKEPVFCISLLLALASCLLVHPDWDYLAYPDYRTLALLFCLMIVLAGFQSLGVLPCWAGPCCGWPAVYAGCL